MSNADTIFWRQFGALLVALILFGVICAFIARSIGGDAHRAAMNNPVAVAERIAPEDGQAMLADSDWRVRLRLAERLPLAAIECLIRDEDGDVQAVAAARLADSDVETLGPGAER